MSQLKDIPTPSLSSYGNVTELPGSGSTREQLSMMYARYQLAARRLAIRFKLIPGTMKGKEELKRLIYGKLTGLPHELDPSVTVGFEPVRLPVTTSVPSYKVLYAIGVL